MVKKIANPDIVYPVNGIKLSSIHSGMYNSQRLDLAIIEIEAGSSVSGIFTKNNIKSPSVIISKNNLNKMNPKYLIINSGNANAGTGKKAMKTLYSIVNIYQMKHQQILKRYFHFQLA